MCVCGREELYYYFPVSGGMEECLSDYHTSTRLAYYHAVMCSDKLSYNVRTGAEFTVRMYYCRFSQARDIFSGLRLFE